MLNSKQRASMRGEAQTIQSVVQIGKEGLNEQVLKGCQDAFNTRELVKVSVLNTVADDIKDLAQQIAVATRAEVVETKGRTIVLYKFNGKLKHNK